MYLLWYSHGEMSNLLVDIFAIFILDVLRVLIEVFSELFLFDCELVGVRYSVCEMVMADEINFYQSVADACACICDN